MSSQPLHISAAIPAAIAALTRQRSLASECAELDSKNPNAIEHWNMRVNQILRYRGGEEALRYLLFEVASRRSDRQATSKSYTNAIARPAAWLNSQTLKWLTAARTRAARKENNKCF
jgi:hypothetical protein